MSRKSEYLGSLETAIILRYMRRPNHRETVFVSEKTKGGEMVWNGRVEVFDLAGHDEANTCYAWRHIENDGELKIFTVLGNHLINSAKKAVQTAIFVGVQRIYPRTKR